MSDSFEQAELEGAIFDRLVTRAQAIALELRGLRLARGERPIPERVTVVCREATLLNSIEALRAIEQWSDWRRQIEGAIAIDGTTLCLTLTGGLSLMIRCAAWRIERAALAAEEELERTRAAGLATVAAS